MIPVKNAELLIAELRSRYGWAVAEQAQDIINGEAVEEQNPNALKYILDVAISRGEHEMAEIIADHLGIPYEPEEETGDEYDAIEVSNQDFINLVNAKFGWSVRQQAEAILNGEDLDEQNPNALEYIMDLAELKGRDDIASMIGEYLDKGEVY